MANKLTLILVMGCLLLVGILGLELWLTKDNAVVDIPPQKTIKPKKLELPHYEVANFSDYDDIIKRPLFSNTRLPVVDEEAPGPVVVAGPLKLLLKSVISSPTTQMISVEDLQDNKKNKWIKKGATIRGWKLTDILEDKAIFKKGGNSQELLLREYKKVPRKPGRGKTRQPALTPAMRNFKGHSSPSPSRLRQLGRGSPIKR